MRRYRPFILLGLAAVIAFSTSSMVYRWLMAQSEASKPAEPVVVKTLGLAVAGLDIPRGATITAEMVKTGGFPEEGLPVGVFPAEQVAGLVGRVPTVDLVQNELILESKLAPVDGTGGVTALLDPTKRAMSVRVDDEVGVAGFVKPNDRVDVFVTVEKEDQADGTTQVVTKLVLADTPVLAIGTELVRSGKEEEAKPVKVITLEVTPEEAEKLALASTQGKFRLALRSPLSKDVVYTRGATIESLLNSYQGASTVSPEEGQANVRASVQLIKGKDASIVSF